MYYPGSSKSAPSTWLEPLANPPRLWPAPPAGLEQINFDFFEHSLNPTVGTATNLYLGTVVFTYPGPGANPGLSFGFGNGGNAFLIEDGSGAQTDIWRQVETVIVWTLEPSTALLVGLGLSGLAWARRRR